MLNVQNYLQTHTLEQLSEELGIIYKFDNTEELVVLNYSQTDSPKTNPIVRECRGLVLEVGTWEIVARAFNRFFNWGELVEEQQNFDWSDFIVYDKEDGSLILIYNYKGTWRINTRGSFGVGLVPYGPYTWQELTLKALGVSSIRDLNLNPNLVYVGELCSKYNKIIRIYPEPEFKLLTVYDRKQNYELPDSTLDQFKEKFTLVNRRHFHSIDEIINYLDKPEVDPSFEGFVIRDIHNNRWKIKNKRYVALHRMAGEGTNMFMPKHQIEYILNGEQDEVCTYFPEVRDSIDEHTRIVEKAYNDLYKLWEATKDIEDQKTFALAVKDHPFSAILFQLKAKYGTNQTVENFNLVWRSSSQIILKKLFGKNYDVTKWVNVD